MRNNPGFALDDVEAIRQLVRENPWVTFVSFVEGRGLVASHYPVILDETARPADAGAGDAGAGEIVLLTHFGRPDEVLHGLGSGEIMAIVQGPHGYISPGWYESTPAVPTWNFVVAHLHGVPEILDHAENLTVLETLVERFERDLPEPFLMRKTLENGEWADRIAHGTVGFRLRVTRFEAKNKMSQNKPAEVVDRVVDALTRPGPYRNDALARRMVDVRDAARETRR
ncbi:FMN-binding negative transcriptional regulator [Marisediminicola senii]|uniref:FMN-binding negative transcriptional regulator n=1 Tax=Marisediminicola senii TaxID=2711233 RepID=UPI0013EB0AEE|nr:FMN-binding negative transcriptional regulator [Marisediminicola senii]